MTLQDRVWSAVGFLSLAGIAWVIARCCVFYWRIFKTVREGKGKVHSELFGKPDLVAAIALCAWLGNTVLASAFRHEGSSQITNKLLILSAIVYGILVGGIILFLRFRKISVVQAFGLRPERPLDVVKNAVKLLALALPPVLCCFGLMRLIMGDNAEPQEIIKFFIDAMQRMDWLRLLLAGVMAVLVAPVAEEFLFRGYFYGTFRRYLGAIPALLLTSLLFAAIHANALAFAPLFVLAICLALAYEATGSLFAPMLMHALFNAAMLVMTFYSAGNP